MSVAGAGAGDCGGRKGSTGAASHPLTTRASCASTRSASSAAAATSLVPSNGYNAIPTMTASSVNATIMSSKRGGHNHSSSRIMMRTRERNLKNGNNCSGRKADCRISYSCDSDNTLPPNKQYKQLNMRIKKCRSVEHDDHTPALNAGESLVQIPT